MSDTIHLPDKNLKFLKGGGELGELTRNFDWSKTVLGPAENWPRSLQTMVGVMLRSKMPMFLWWGNDLIQFYNDAYRPSLGVSGKHPTALGQHGKDCWPEIWPVIKPMIDQVLSGGESTWQEDALIPIYRNNALEDVYWTFSYSCVPDDEGEPGGVLVICTETTQKIKLFNALNESAHNLEKTIDLAEKDRDRMKRFLMEAPAGICILEGEKMVYEFVNPIYQQLFPGRELLGKPLLEAIPEISDQPIIAILHEVYRNNKTYEGDALLIPLPAAGSGVLEDRYFNFIYQPKSAQDGQVNGIMVFAFDVTSMVKAEKELEKTKETLDSAIKAAQVGIFSYDMQSGGLEVSDQCRTIFEIASGVQVEYHQDFILPVHPDDLQRALDLVYTKDQNRNEDGNYDVEFRIRTKTTQQLKWVKSRGKVYFDQDNQPVRVIGAMLDITEQKSDEIRKNDFIGIVSHELKTPLTSLTVYLQMLSRNGGTGNTFIDGAHQRMYAQVKKMTSMITGFLNISRFEAGKIEIDTSLFNTRELLTEIREELEMTTETHHISIVCPEDFVTYADRVKIGSVISNLLSNAIKYSPQGREIKISCFPAENGQLFAVKDEGMGIPPEDLPRLFDRFYRVSSKETHNISGFGIGLYLCAEIIRFHGGQIWAESDGHAGSTFFFSLPNPGQ